MAFFSSDSESEVTDLQDKINRQRMIDEAQSKLSWQQHAQQSYVAPTNYWSSWQQPQQQQQDSQQLKLDDLIRQMPLDVMVQAKKKTSIGPGNARFAAKRYHRPIWTRRYIWERSMHSKYTFPIKQSTRWRQTIFGPKS